MSVRQEIECDGDACVEASRQGHMTDWEFVEVGERIHVTRARLKAKGWRVGLPGGRDLCPECARDERIAREALR